MSDDQPDIARRIDEIEGWDGSNEAALESLVDFIETVALDRKSYFDELNPNESVLTRAQWMRLGMASFSLQSRATGNASRGPSWRALEERLARAVQAIRG